MISHACSQCWIFKPWRLSSMLFLLMIRLLVNYGWENMTSDPHSKVAWGTSRWLHSSDLSNKLTQHCLISDWDHHGSWQDAPCVMDFWQRHLRSLDLDSLLCRSLSTSYIILTGSSMFDIRLFSSYTLFAVLYLCWSPWDDKTLLKVGCDNDILNFCKSNCN